MPIFYLGLLVLAGCSGKGGSSTTGDVNADSTDEHVSSGEHIPLTGLSELTPETFQLKTALGGAFKTKGGLLVYFPPGCVVAENGKSVEEELRISIRQAYTPAKWIEAGIGTASFGHPHEALGVFMIEIRGTKARKYTIDPKLGYYVSVPEAGHRLTGWEPGQAVPVTRAQENLDTGRWRSTPLLGCPRPRAELETTG